MSVESPKHVVVIGGGFGGLTVARKLAKEPVRVTVVDRENHHVFQPLLYQVASAALSPGDIAMPIRSVVRRHRNVRVIMGEVVGADPSHREVILENGARVAYDYLVVAAGSKTNYYGRDEWGEHAHGLKSIRDALRVRERILMAFEAAERADDPERRRSLLTFVVVGAGPTGVEMAGAISELSRHTMRRDFRRCDPTQIRVVLVEMANRVLSPFAPVLSEKAEQQLRELQVEVRTGSRVTGVSGEGIELEGERIPASVVVWASGVRSVGLVDSLGLEQEGGRIAVGTDCRVRGHHEIFAIGDIAHFVPPGADVALPGLAPVAMQQGRFVARVIAREMRGRATPSTFRYRDKGIMATIGRSRAVAQTKRLRLTGRLAWLAWLVVHLIYLIGFRNRLIVVLNWFFAYVTYKRGVRLIALSQPNRLPRELARLAGRE